MQEPAISQKERTPQGVITLSNPEQIECGDNGFDQPIQSDEIKVGTTIAGVAKPATTKCFARFLQIAFLLLGTVGILAIKWQNMIPVHYKYQGSCTSGKTCPPCTDLNQPTVDVCKQPYYTHPFIQTILVLMGGFLSIFLFIYQRCEKKAKQKYEIERIEAIAQGRRPTTWRLFFLILFPAALFLIVCTLNSVALIIVPASILTMIQSLWPFLVAIYSICALNMDLYVHNYIAFLFVLVGTILVAITGWLDSEGSSSGNANGTKAQYAVAILLLFLSCALAALYLVIDEILYQTWFLVPSQVMCTEGFWGLILMTILLSIICNIPCDSYSLVCIYNPNKEMFYLENIDTWLQQMSENGWLIFAVCLNIVCTGLDVLLGQSITKYLNAVTRSLTTAARSGLIWLAGIIITLLLPEDPIWKPWESLQWQNILLQFIGYFLIALALLFHLMIIKLPYKHTWFHEILVPCPRCKCNKRLKNLQVQEQIMADESINQRVRDTEQPQHTYSSSEANLLADNEKKQAIETVEDRTGQYDS